MVVSWGLCFDSFLIILFLCFMQIHYPFPTMLGGLVRVEVGTASILVLQGNERVWRIKHEHSLHVFEVLTAKNGCAKGS